MVSEALSAAASSSATASASDCAIHNAQGPCELVLRPTLEESSFESSELFLSSSPVDDHVGWPSKGTGGSVVMVSSMTSVSLNRYQSQMLRPLTRRTHARPTGFSRASKSEGPGRLSAAVSALTVRATANDRSEPNLINRPNWRAYQVVTRALRATIRRRCLPSTA